MKKVTDEGILSWGFPQVMRTRIFFVSEIACLAVEVTSKVYSPTLTRPSLMPITASNW